MERGIAYYQRSPEKPALRGISRIPLNPHGEKSPYVWGAIRNKDLAIGITNDDGLVVCYSQPSGRAGNHDHIENIILSVARERLTALVHGSITFHPQEKAHVISLYKMHPVDIYTHGGKSFIEELEAKQDPRDIGRTFPERFITPPIAQRLLHGIGGDILEILTAQPSVVTCGLEPAGNYPNIQAARNLLREGD